MPLSLSVKFGLAAIAAHARRRAGTMSTSKGEYYVYVVHKLPLRVCEVFDPIYSNLYVSIRRIGQASPSSAVFQSRANHTVTSCAKTTGDLETSDSASTLGAGLPCHDEPCLLASCFFCRAAGPRRLTSGSKGWAVLHNNPPPLTPISISWMK